MCSFGAYQGAPVVENPLANVGDVRDASSISGSGRSPGGGNGNPLQYSCLKNSMSRRAWQTAVCGGLWVCKELDTTECTHARVHTHTHTHTHTQGLENFCFVLQLKTYDFQYSYFDFFFLVFCYSIYVLASKFIYFPVILSS